MDTAQVATKKDILALKSDIKSLGQSTKADIEVVKSDIKSLRQVVLKVEKRVENLEEGQKRVETKIDTVEERLGTKLDKIMDTLDGFVGRVDNLTTDNEIGTHQTRELRLQVDDHEKRLKHIESSKHAA